MISSCDISSSLRSLGVNEGDICLFHSSFKSLGPVDGGAESVIRGFESVLGADGTLVAPTLCQRDFINSYKTWHLDKPSDVGYLTEYFRKLPGVCRSDQATHSVAARGRLAYELTYEHTARGPRACPFGGYAFCDSSPWMKMYLLNAKVVFIGVSMRYHTMKHLIEGMYIEELLSKSGEKEDALRGKLRKFGIEDGIWPFYDSVVMQGDLETLGLVKKACCGEAELLCVEACPSSDEALKFLRKNPSRYISDKNTLAWISKAISGGV